MAIKLIDPAARFEIVSENDESIVRETPEELAKLTADKGKSRYNKYMDSLDLADLTLDPAKGAPTLFVVRCLTNEELASLHDRYLSFDIVTRKTQFSDYPKFLTECFNTAILGIKKADGSIQKISSKDIEMNHYISVGGLISYLTSTGRHLKNI